MRVETLSDVLEWTVQFHQHMATCLSECASRHPDQRAQMLLHYLSDHEKSLAKTVAGFKNIGGENALKTWCYDHLDQHPIVHREPCDAAFHDMSAEEIMGEVMTLHDDVVALYHFLADRADIPEAEELMRNLLSLEEHQIMIMTQAANRLHDF